ncbi:MAG TPA: helix-turn-helix transcriptional regulator [Candidatus Rikenella faecigallinarum]|uniref:Helix-turn-helix transcriptional regulator n=1 Tax=Candidatus Rikenella faecigallinarum TaxID=2838745 RepID=A0A9D1TXN4_9BACT|nr:helix-turn-helix transcriptional regulator [Candidatus Rikenella faecigallinarum]
MAVEKNVRNFQASGSCPIRNVLSRLSEKWPMLVLVTLQANGKMRFNELQRAIGDISQRMLSVTLRTLVADGLVLRVAHAEIPPRVEYELTGLGDSLMPHINALIGWAQQHFSEVTARRGMAD